MTAKRTNRTTERRKRFVVQAAEIEILKRVVMLELVFPRRVTSKRATEVARQIARAIQVDLLENGSDLWPGEVPKVRVRRGVTS